jgi:pimeloyl-ACP methyl ester carboxylesterase
MADSAKQHWLLLRGLARESAHWGAFLPQLQAAFPQDCITTLDLPGTGRFIDKSSPKRIEAIAEVVRQQALDDGLLQQPVILVGMSLGGMVAWQWLKQYSRDAVGGVLINSSFASLSRFYQRLRWQAYGDFFPLLAKQDAFELELGIVRLVSNLEDAQRQVIAQHWADIRRQRPMAIANIARQLQAAARYRPDPQRPQQPILLLNSAGDRLVSSNCSEAISRQYQIPLHTHPNAGHDLALDDPAWIIQRLQDVAQSARIPGS